MSSLMAGVPGGLTYWNAARLEKVSVWGDQLVAGNGSGYLEVALPPVSGWSQPATKWIDEGTLGNNRPHISFKYGILERARFLSTADDTPLFSVEGGQDTGQAVIHATLELVSPALS